MCFDFSRPGRFPLSLLCVLAFVVPSSGLANDAALLHDTLHQPDAQRSIARKDVVDVSWLFRLVRLVLRYETQALAKRCIRDFKSREGRCGRR